MHFRVESAFRIITGFSLVFAYWLTTASFYEYWFLEDNDKRELGYRGSVIVGKYAKDFPFVISSERVLLPNNSRIILVDEGDIFHQYAHSITLHEDEEVVVVKKNELSSILEDGDSYYIAYDSKDYCMARDFEEYLSAHNLNTEKRTYLPVQVSNFLPSAIMFEINIGTLLRCA